LVTVSSEQGGPNPRLALFVDVVQEFERQTGTKAAGHK
jgi:hypothetical protein